MKKEYNVPAEKIDELKNKIEKLNKKAAKYGQTVVVEYGEPEPMVANLEEVSFGVAYDIGEYHYMGVKVTVDDESVVKQDGWEFVAAVDLMAGGNVVVPITGKVNDAWRSIGCHCDHCNTDRKRNRIYVVTKDGAEKHVGRTCLKDYTGIYPQAIVAAEQIQTLVKDYEPSEGCKPQRLYSVEEIIATAIDVYEERGYKKSGEQGCNKDIIADIVMARKAPENHEKAIAMIAAIKALPRETAKKYLLEDTQAILSQDYVSPKYFGYLAYAPVAYAKYFEESQKPVLVSNYVGEIGSKVVFTVAERRILTTYEGMYGTTYIWLLTDENGNQIKWKTNRGVVWNGATITAKVKDHTVYNGIKQTEITRGKVSERHTEEVYDSDDRLESTMKELLGVWDGTITTANVK